MFLLVLWHVYTNETLLNRKEIFKLQTQKWTVSSKKEFTPELGYQFISLFVKIFSHEMYNHVTQIDSD